METHNSPQSNLTTVARRYSYSPTAGETLYPSIRQAVWLLLLTFLLIVALGFSLGVLGPILGASLVGAVVNLAAFGLILRWGLRKTQASFKEVFPLTAITTSLLLPIALTALGLSVLLSEADNLFRTVLPMSEDLADFFMEIFSGGESLWATMLLTVVVGPATEELLFRGLILRGFLSRYSVTKAILASSLLFGLFHMNPWQFLTATIVGVFFAWLFVKTGSLLPCFFGHAVFNTVPLLGAFDVKIQGLTTSLTRVEFQPLWLDLTGLLVAVLGLWLLIRAFREVRETDDLDVPTVQP